MVQEHGFILNSQKIVVLTKWKAPVHCHVETIIPSFAGVLDVFGRLTVSDAEGPPGSNAA